MTSFMLLGEPILRLLKKIMPFAFVVLRLDDTVSFWNRTASMSSVGYDGSGCSLCYHISNYLLEGTKTDYPILDGILVTSSDRSHNLD